MIDVAAFALQMEFLMFSGVFCAILLGWLVVFILIAVWVYRDAESRGMSGVLWLLVVILLGLIGLIIYLIVRGSHPVRLAGSWPTAPGMYPPPGYAPPPGYGPPPGGYAPPPGGYAPPPSGYAPPPSGYPPSQAPPPPAAGPACKNCGSLLPAGAQFCAKCGAKQ